MIETILLFKLILAIDGKIKLISRINGTQTAKFNIFFRITFENLLNRTKTFSALSSQKKRGKKQRIEWPRGTNNIGDKSLLG